MYMYICIYIARHSKQNKNLVITDESCGRKKLVRKVVWLIMIWMVPIFNKQDNASDAFDKTHEKDWWLGIKKSKAKYKSFNVIFYIYFNACNNLMFLLKHTYQYV